LLKQGNKYESKVAIEQEGIRIWFKKKWMGKIKDQDSIRGWDFSSRK
jgi:hypothetical protein